MAADLFDVSFFRFSAAIAVGIFAARFMTDCVDLIVLGFVILWRRIMK